MLTNSNSAEAPAEGINTCEIQGSEIQYVKEPIDRTEPGAWRWWPRLGRLQKAFERHDALSFGNVQAKGL